MSTESITLRQHMLGMAPYVLLTFGVEDDGESVKVDVEYGGGLPNKTEVRDGLLLALTQMGPFSNEEIDMLREVE